MGFISFTGALHRDGSVAVLYAGTDGGAAVEAMEKAFTEADPAKVAEIHCVRNAQPFQRRFLAEPPPASADDQAAAELAAKAAGADPEPTKPEPKKGKGKI